MRGDAHCGIRRLPAGRPCRGRSRVSQEPVADDAQYLDPRLVALYDALNPPDTASAFYMRLVGQPPKRVLDIGCGTGQLAIDLASAGHDVTGMDPAPPMLEVARRNDAAGGVTWIAADARSLTLGQRFDVAIMTGHVFQVFLTDEDIARVLATAYAHLLPGGSLAFETRNPKVRPWERWSRERSRRTVTVQPFGPVVVSYEVRGIAGDIVRFATHHEFAARGDTITTESSLRFLDAEAVVAHLRDAGFDQVTLYGDWDRSAVSASSPQIIVHASTASREQIVES
jgi:ubiquinone/menaquinone biosynthesis C-methylase UbiE